MPEDITLQPLEAPPAGAASASSGIKAFFGSTLGKIIVIGAAVGLLLAVAAVVGVVLLLGSVKPEIEIVNTAQPASNLTSGTVPGASDEPTAVPPAVPDSEVFTFRDVFKPLILPAASTTPPAQTPGSAPTTSTAGDPNTLYLQDVVVEGGKDKAVLTYNGTSYTLGEGEIVTNTPWKVLTVDASEDSVVMLYGDSQVTLTVGEGTASSK